MSYETCKACDFVVGHYYCNGTDAPVKVVRKSTVNESGGIVLELAEPRNGKPYRYFMKDSEVKFQILD